MALPVCPGCRKTIIPKSDDSCPNCGFKGIEKGATGVEPTPAPPPSPSVTANTAPSASLAGPAAPEPEYGGFWIRLAALLLDLIILSPITLLSSWVMNLDRKMIYITLIPSLMITVFYHILCVQYWGGTPGKLICGLRVVTPSFKRIGWKEAWLRYSFNLAMVALSTIWYLHAIEQMSDAEYLRLGFMDRSRRMVELGGMTWKVFNWSNQIWTWSEFLVLLTNRQRRALHDFIAGTVVVRKP